MKKQKHLKRSLLCTSVLLALCSNAGSAPLPGVDYGSDNNFTMLDPAGGRVGGTNDVAVTWDETLNTDVVTAVTNMTIASTHPFFGQPWFAHDVKVYGPGTYVIEACPAPINVPIRVAADGSSGCVASAEYTMNVGAGQVGVHMLFDWNSSVNIDVINVMNTNDIWGYGPNNGTKSKLETELSPCIGIGKKADLTTPECVELFATKWLFTSTDPDGDGVPGSPMIDGPFGGFNAAFNIRGLGVFEPHNDSAFTVENDSVVTADVLANDQLLDDPSGFAITTFDMISEKGGAVTDNSDNTYSYLPPVNFMGIDSFNYTVSDGILTGSAKVEVVVLSEEAAAVLLPQLKGATTSTGSSTASGEGESGGIGATGFLALPLMLLLLPLRLFSRGKTL